MKLAALEAIVAERGVAGADVMYVGDSITDAPPLAAVKAWGGVALSFNGNGYALAAAEFAAASPDAEVHARAGAGVRARRPRRPSRPPSAPGRALSPASARRGRARARVGVVAEERGRARRSLRRDAAERPRRARRPPRLIETDRLVVSRLRRIYSSRPKTI